MSISITEFLETIFGERAKDVSITSRPHDARKNSHWVPRRWDEKDPSLENDNYFVISILRREGGSSRQEKHFEALYLLVLDDIGGKYGAPENWGEPTYKMQTSIKDGVPNYQWGYVLDAPITDKGLAKSFLKLAVNKSKVSDNVGDVTRNVRLAGKNNKPDKDADGRCVMVTEWHPQNKFSIEQILAFENKTRDDLVITTENNGEIAEDVEGHPVLEAFNKADLLLADRPNENGWIATKCPWHHSHTNETGTETGIMFREDMSFAMSCFHSSCKVEGEDGCSHKTDRVLARVQELGGGDIAVIKSETATFSAIDAFKDLPKSDTKEATNIEDLIKKYLYIVTENKFFDVHQKTSIPQIALDNSYLYIQQFSKRKASQVFLSHPNRKVVDGVGFLPNNEDVIDLHGLSLANSYKPPTLEREKGDVSLWLRLMNHIYGQYVDLVIDHMAFTVQRPEEKIRWQILAHGTPRTGKTLTVLPIQRIFNGHCKTIKVSQDEKYDDEYIGAKVVVFEEVFGDRRNYNALKSKLANSDLETLNLKSKAKVIQQNSYSIYMFSNHDNALAIDTDGDKLLVIKTAEEPLENEFYVEYGRAFAQKGKLANYVYDFLLDRDVSNFRFNSLPIRTDAAIAMSLAGDKEVIDYLREQSENGYGVFEPLQMHDLDDEVRGLYELPIITRDVIRQELRDEGLWNSYIEVKSILERIGYVLLPQGQLKNFGKTPSIYVPKDAKVLEMSTGDRYKWTVELFLLHHNDQLLNQGMKKYVKDLGLTRSELVASFGGRTQNTKGEMLD
jgi:hypothetical protein